MVKSLELWKKLLKLTYDYHVFYNVFGDFILNKTTWGHQFSVYLTVKDKSMGLISKYP